MLNGNTIVQGASMADATPLAEGVDLDLKADDGHQLFSRYWAPSGTVRGTIGLIHGIGEHCGRYAWVADQLNRAGFAVMSFDHRGHGHTAGKRGYVRRFSLLLDDVGALLERLKKIHPDCPAFLYGHSLGGLVVLNYGIRRQTGVRAIVATSPLLIPTHAPPAWKLTLGRLFYRVWPTFSLDNGINYSQVSSQPAADDGCERDPLVHRRISARLGLDMLDAGRWTLDHAGSLRIPTMLCHGMNDQLTSAEAARSFAQTSSAVRLHLVDSAFHELHGEPDRDALLQAIIYWLGQQT